MTVEHANTTNRRSPFPAHWTGLEPGQSQGEREGAIWRNMRRDAETRGDDATVRRIDAAVEKRVADIELVEELEKHGGRTYATEFLRKRAHLD